MARKRKSIQQAGSSKLRPTKLIETTPRDTNSENFVWNPRLLDLEVGTSECDWTWDLEPSELRPILECLHAASKKTWGELESERTGGKRRHKKHHSHPIMDLPREAQSRLEQIQLDESYTELFRLRYSGTGRLWGARDGCEFLLLWADPRHRVYPTDPNG